MVTRCAWCGSDPRMTAYHDEEWGVPEYDDRRLLEMLILEGAQAGLSWSTILNKRENYRRAFHFFDARKIAAYGDADVARLLADAGIVRNRLKVASAIKNARAAVDIARTCGSLSAYLWDLAGGTPRQNAWRTLADVPARTEVSDLLSRELKKRGCTFVGTTIMYAFMQAVGMVNDHVVGCHRHDAVAKLAR